MVLTSIEVHKRVIRKPIHGVQRGYHKADEEKHTFGDLLYRPEVRLDLEKPILWKDSLDMTEGEPWIIRNAKALAYYLAHETIRIDDGYRIVGDDCGDKRAIPWPIEKYSKWVERVARTHGRTMIEDKDWPKFEEILRRWEGLTEWDREEPAIPPWLKKYWHYDGTFIWAQWNEGGFPNYRRIIATGYNALIKQCEDRLKEIEQTLPVDYVDQKDFLSAAIIALKGVINWAGRYAQLARELAEKEKDKVRKRQLEEVAEVCDWVPANPARTFHEALQSYWFNYVVRTQKENAAGGNGFRFDLCTGPYYEKDLKEERITREDAVELTALLFSKISELSWLYSPLLTGVYAGSQILQNITLGGVDENGHDVTNECTYIAMDAAARVRTNEPSIALRVHNGTPRDVILKAIDLIKSGLGYPSLHNDNVIIPLNLRWEWPLRDARAYGVVACVAHTFEGQQNSRGYPGWFSLAKCLWWAMNKGIDPATGEQHGAATKDPLEWSCYEDALEAYLEQVRFFMDKQLKIESISRVIYSEWLPRPFYSAILDGCIERGQHHLKWEYPHKGGTLFWNVLGPVNVANSLAAIKKRVFEEKKVTMKKLLEALEHNYEGYEEIHRFMLSAPKFGNDDDYVDLIANEVQVRTTQVAESFNTIYGFPGALNGSNAATIFGFSYDCGALPDGRLSGEHFADGTVSPAPGTDTKGPTAVLKSASKIDTVNTYCHLLNQRFMPQLLEGEGKERFADYIKTWLDLGIPHIQFNVVDKDVLLDAQVHPEQHMDLLVRVAGYSAYFVDLSKGMQEGIIARTEQHAW